MFIAPAARLYALMVTRAVKDQEGAFYVALMCMYVFLRPEVFKALKKQTTIFTSAKFK